jgi:hypothetical protein
MSKLLQRLDDPNHPYCLEVHPFYDWSKNTIEIFGTWQGGPHNRWSPCGGNKETVLDAGLTYYASDFGNELRSPDAKKVEFKGRKSRTSSQQRTYTNGFNNEGTFCHASMQMADFYVGSYIEHNKKRLRAVFVLGDAECAVETSGCNDVEHYHHGKRLHQYLLRRLPMPVDQNASPMAAGSYHRDSETNNNEVTFFPGHLDKPFVHTAWFVPIGKASFFTIISVSRVYHVVQEPDSLRLFNEWKERLSIRDCQRVDEFLKEFDIQAKKHMRQDSTTRLIYFNKSASHVICSSFIHWTEFRDW